MSRSSEFGTSILIRSAKEYILACLYTRARMTSPGKTNGTTTTHGRFDDGARASPSPVNVILRQKSYRHKRGRSGQKTRLRQRVGVCIDLETRTTRRDARHGELNFLSKAEGRLPIHTIGLCPRYEFAPQKPDHLPGDDIF